MVKKKKPQLKAPVNRGFATVSLPKKELPPKELPVEDASARSAPEQTPAPAPSVEEKQEEPAAALSAGDRELQELADKVLPAAERQSNRRGKTIEMTQRLVPTVPFLSFDRTLTDKVLDAAFLEEHVESAPRKLPTDKAPAEDAPISIALAADSDIDDILVRALTIRALLKQFGFSDTHVDMAIRYAPTLELEEAIAWLVCVLPSRQVSATAIRGPQMDVPEDLPVPVRHPAFSFERRSASSVQTETTPRVAETALESVADDTRQSLIESAVRTLALAKEIMASEATWESSLEHPTETWAAARAASSLVDQERARRRKAVGAMDARLAEALDDSAFQERARATQEQAMAVLRQCETQHEFERAAAARLFGERMRAAVESSRAAAEAEAQEEVRRAQRRAQIEKLHRQAAGEHEQPAEQPAERPTDHDTTTDAAPAAASTVDTQTPETEQENDVDNLADMFTEQVATDEGASVRLRELASGAGSNRSAKVILGDSLRHADMHARIRYTPLASGSVKRSKLEIRWSSRRDARDPIVDTYTLTGEGCATAQLADDLVATVALHTIERDRPVQRMLGAGFRDFWDELDAARREQRDAEARENVSHMQSLLRDRSGGVSLPKAAEERPLAPPQVRGGGESAALPDYAALTSSPSYLGMLPGRQNLPIAAQHDHILNTINSSQVTVLSGETGCGKSTQLPAYLLEDCLARGEQCRIYVTEPRRISAISLAQRVSQELGEAQNSVGTDGSLVGYAIRLETHVARSTRLVYATTGIVLRMLESDAFDGITHIVVDEVHERSIESDFLLIVLKTLAVHRPSLKIVLMSATLDAERISAYFGGCPTLAVPGRTFPVEVNFLEDVLQLTGYKLQEDSPYARRNLSDKPIQLEGDEDDEDEETSSASTVPTHYSPETADTLLHLNEHVVNHELIIRLLECLCLEGVLGDNGAILVFLPGMADIRRIYDALLAHRGFGNSAFLIYALHSSVASEGQGAVFDIPPPGVRKIVLSTNIAETGVTIPDITCVIDSGKRREMRYDEKRKISRLVECFVARSNAKQRRGRAGRVQEGVCYHLFTRARHDNLLEEHSVPEMLRLSLQELALKLKVMRIRIGDSIEDALSQALDPPLAVNVQHAVNSLVEVDALTPTQEITALGRHLSHMPLDVHLGKFLLVAVLFRCVDPALTIAAVLSSKSPFVTPIGQERNAQRMKASLLQGDSDFFTYAYVFMLWRKHVRTGNAKRFCTQHYLSSDVLFQIEDLRQQYLSYLIDSGFMRDDWVRRELSRSRRGARPRLVDVPAEFNVRGDEPAAVMLALTAALYPKVLASDGSQLRTLTNNQPTHVHPSSALRGVPLNRPGTHVLYYTIMMSRRLYAWEVAVVDTRALLLVCGDVEFRHSSSTLTLDKTRGRFAIRYPDSLVAIRVLRDQLTRAINASFKSPGMPWSPQLEYFFTLALRVLAP